MPVSLIPSFILYCLVSSITPGPANLCSLAAAMKYGKKQALVQWRGLFTGFTIVALAASVLVWFFGMLLHQYLKAISVIGAAYILYLAWHIFRSSGGGEATARPHCGFMVGLLVQLTNVKIMIYCMTALAVYAFPYADSYVDVLKIALLLPFTGPLANLVWLFTGVSLQKFFRAHEKPLNTAMAVALALCAVSILMSS